WFYGYMPKTDGAIFDVSNKTMSVPGIPGLSTDNAMLIRIDEGEHTNRTLDIAQDQKEATVSLKMDHLMAKVTPHFYINAAYNNVRTIKVKKVEFSIDNASKYTASINYTNPIEPEVSWTPASTENLSLTAFENTSDAPALTTDKQAIGQFFLCPAQSVEHLKMRVTYDVYDKKGALTRENVRAENSILKLKKESITAGTNYKLNIQVVPTYLYILSDNDEESVLIIE
ncbi:MAG: fimbrillin family protein, partial [Bacteroidales bacterium]|nr:fimbrillin family protein [Bacteroidales bacterium]